LKDLFFVSGDPSDEEIVWEGDLRRVHNIGAETTRGRTTVRGPSGLGLGRGMAGGTIEAFGEAGDEAGAMMRGGVLWVHGGVGDRAASSDLGFRKGMRGGTFVIEGDAGDDLARGIRRGTVFVQGACGAGVMTEAVAGTVVVAGRCGPRVAPGMARGTLVLLGAGGPGDGAFEPLPTFLPGRRGRPTFLNLLFRELVRMGVELPASAWDGEFHQFHGDCLGLGLGEVFVRCG
jgi:formylmethanofuran dehydrogenase subunit C